MKNSSCYRAGMGWAYRPVGPGRRRVPPVFGVRMWPVLPVLAFFVLSLSPFPAHATQSEPLLQTYLYDVANPLTESSISGVSGAFTHSIPIVIPPGRNGMQPSLGFNYSSHGGTELNTLGYGWDIPIPYIQRLNKTGTQNLYTADTFTSTLSGELATTTTPGVFLPRSDDGSYLSYTFASSTNQWTVVDRKGTTYKFGHASTTRQDNPADSTKVYKWMLQEMRDTNNNYVKYEYTKDQGFIYPYRITYTGNNVTDGIFRVDFSLESRPDNATSSAPGFEVESRYRLNQVTALINGVWARKYDLTYTLGDADRRSLLDTITESAQAFDTGTSSIATLPTTNFDYRPTGSGWATTTSTFELPIAFRETYVDTGLRVVDFNGDALPDLIRAKQGTTTLMYVNDGDSWNLDANWSFPEYLVDSDGGDLGVRFLDSNGDGLVDFMRRTGSSDISYLNTGSGWATTSVWTAPTYLSTDSGGDNGTRFADVNGDGLVDVLRSTWTPIGNTRNINVYLNTGSGWVDSGWDIPIAFVNFWPGAIDTLGTLVDDVNGDGLADLVTKDDDQYGDLVGVFLNTGSGWDLESSWTIPGNLASGGNDNGQRLLDVNGDRLVDYVDGSTGNQKVYLNNGSNWVLDTSWSLPISLNTQDGYASLFTDVDADGMIDLIQRNSSVHSRFINQAHPADILSHIDSSSGSKTDAVYGSSANVTLNANLPAVIETALQIGLSDGLGTTATTTYQYENGEFYFNTPLDRMFAGFGVITKTDPDDNLSKTFYHQGNATASSTGEYNDHRSKIGQVFRSEVYDDNENLYSLQVRGLDHYNRGPNADFYFVATSSSLSYDGDADHKDLAETFAYSTTTGSLAQKISWGEVDASTSGSFTDTGNDKRTSTYTYVASSTSNLLLPLQETVTNQVGSTTRETKNYYDTLAFGSVGKGNLTKQEYWVTGTSTIDIEKIYNTYGLVTRDTDPRNKNTNYTYDTYNLYTSTTTNAVSHIIGRLYDYSSGKVRRLTDENSRVFETLYDPFDRPIEEKQPDLTTPTTLVTRATYQYNDTSMPRRVQKTENLDGSTSIDSFTYTNGLGKTVEERIEAEGSNTYAVRDFVYNNRWLLASESLPFFASSTAYTATSSPPVNTLLTEYEYDPLDRVVSATNVLGVTANTYDQWRVSTSDALDNVKEIAKDAYGNLTQVVEHNDGNQYATNYEYDGNNKLTKITDADGNVRNFTYNGLGRRLTAQDIHDAADGTYGTWTYIYDNSGNLTRQVTPRNHTVDFTYDNINRVLTENYTGASGTEVTYQYDVCGQGKGWLCSATTSASIINYAYNPLGLLQSESRKFGTTTYATSYTYDRLGNQAEITYPDSSQVRYGYNNAGQLESVEQKENGGSYGYVVSNINYSPTGKVTRKEFANGVTSTYTYDPAKLYRLSRIFTFASSTDLGGWELAQFVAIESEPTSQVDIENDLASEIGPSLADPIVEQIVESPPVVETPIIETVPDPALTENEDIVSGEGSVVDPRSTESSSSTPESLLPSDGPASSAAATTTSQILDPIPTEIVATSTDALATSTPELLIPATTKQFLLETIPGRRLATGGNIKEVEVGKDEKGNPMIEATIFSGDVQYEDAVTGEIRDINISLRDSGPAWVMEQAPYSARLSKEADDKPVTYRTGMTELYFSPVSSSTTSIVGTRQTSGREAIRYPDALGDGVDLEVTVTPSALWKEAVLQSADALMNLQSNDGYVEVPFLLESNDEIDLVSIEGVSLREAGSFTSSSPVEVVSSSGDRAYFRAPLASDNSGRETGIAIRYSITAEGITLTKLLPLSWLESANYPVRTDTVVTYNPISSGDAYIGAEAYSSSWDTVHDLSSATTTNSNSLVVASGYNSSMGKYSIWRATIPFDTSALPDTAVVTEGTVSLRTSTMYHRSDGGNHFVRLVQTTVASTTAPADGDFDQIGAVDNPTGGADDVYIQWIGNGNWVNIGLNATGTSWINTSGYTKFGLREGFDATDTAYSQQVGAIFESRDAWNSSDMPKLTLTYVLPIPPDPPTDLLVEEQTNPVNITDYAPEFSAIYQDPDDGDFATSYQIQVASSTSYWGAPLWDSGQIALSSTLLEGSRMPDVAYEGQSLTASTTYYWRTRFWDESGAIGNWSTTTASFSIADSGATITPTYKSISTGTWTAASSINIAKPPGLEEGDLMIALIATDSSVGSPPTGWTTINAAVNTNNRVGLSIFGKVAQAEDVATSTYAFSGSSWAINGSILRIANADLGTATSSLVYKPQSWGSNPSTFSPGISPAQPETLLLMAFHATHETENFSGYTLASSSPVWTERADIATSMDAKHMFAVANGSRATSTPTGDFSVNTTNGNQTAEAGYGLLLGIYGNAVPLTPSSLQTEGQTNPANVTDETPEFSAVYEDMDDGDIAGYYKVQVATSTDFTSPFWDSGKTAMTATTTEGSRSPDISYGGSDLTRETTYYWRIKFWDDNNTEGEWSSNAQFFYAISGVTAVIQNMTYTYDAVGNITKIVDVSGTQAAKVVNYTYDDLYRLTLASTTAASTTPYRHAFTYSSIGNITSLATSTATSTTYTYAETGYINPHAPTAIGATTRAYDNAGNLTREGTKAYIWDYNNRMTAAGATGIATTTYGYDFTGQRLTKKTGSTATTTYPNRLYSTNGATTTKQIFDNRGGLIATITGSGSTTIEYLHTDHLGGTNATTDSMGVLGESLDYYPYGGERVVTGAISTDRHYIGERYDSESSLNYLNARYFNPERGQFTSQDPVFWEVAQTGDGSRVLFDPQLQNSYSYARNNPITYEDSEGRIAPLLIGAGLLALTAYDAYDTATTLADPNRSAGEKALAAGLFFSPFGEVKAGVKTLSKADTMLRNAANGARREYQFSKDLVKQYPGASVQKEMYLRNADGSIAKDAFGSGRRIDFAVIKDGKVQELYEVTSPTANKTNQFRKEETIRNNGGTYIKDRQTGKLINVSKVPTKRKDIE